MTFLPPWACYGAAILEDYRRAYAGFGVEWPGDEEIRRFFLIAYGPHDGVWVQCVTLANCLLAGASGRSENREFHR